ncbi:hypothetical protein LY13_000979 [Prauserella aidingensis]|uniref:hypothetical protein n=1 Tax=Prauserella aidingensis TaxID=387890 RepID=UPI0020A61929|nr:hypothetical protein [Prauserella aidingensis]MCP2252240.1 hypothetical protein [Prauserella aidingensis]
MSARASQPRVSGQQGALQRLGQRYVGNRWAALFTLPFLTLIVVAMATGRLLGDGGTTAAVVAGIWVGLAELATVGVVGLTRAHRRRKANLAPYKQAYEKVAHAVVHGGHGIGDRSAADDAR